MAVVASLSEAPVHVEPGRAATTTMVVRNAGNLVDSFVFRPIGASAPWVKVEPAEVSLLPDANVTVTITFSPPRSSDVAAGAHPYAIRIVSRVEDEAGSATVEGVVDVGQFDDRVGELLPRATRGRRRGRNDLAIDNRGNAESTVEVTTKQAEPTLAITVDPGKLTVAPGAAAFARIKVRARKRHWRGTPVNHPYQVVLSDQWRSPLVVDGVHAQEPVLSRGLVRAVALGVLAALALVVLWFAVLRPTVRSQAKAVVNPAVSDLENRVKAAGVPVPPAAKAGGGGGGGAPTTTTTTTAGGGGGTATTAPGAIGGVLGDPIDFRIVAGGPVRATPAGKTFSLTDMVLQNPKAATGTLTVSRVKGGSESALFVSELANFRDFDLHFVAPFLFPDGTSVKVSVACSSSCGEVAVTFAGFER